MLMCMYFCFKKTSFNKSIFLLCFTYVCFLNSIYFLCACECGHIRAMECIYRSEDNFRELAFTFHLVEAKSLLLMVTVSLLQAIWPYKLPAGLPVSASPLAIQCWDYRCASGLLMGSRD